MSVFAKAISIMYHQLIVNLLTFSTGNILSWVSPVIPRINGMSSPEDNPLLAPITENQQAWLVALLPLGSIFGCPIGGFLSSRYGKKRALLWASFPLLLAYTLSAFTTRVEVYLVARLLAGISCGVCFTLIPLYIGETADKDTRGMFGCFFGIFLKLGTVSSYIIGPYFSVKVFSLISALPVVIFLLSFGFCLPETPYHLVSTGKTEKAERVLRKIRKENLEGQISEELFEIREYVREKRSTKTQLQVLMSSKAAMRSLIISTGILSLQQLSGIVIILSYLQPILQASDTRIPPSTASTVIGVIQFFIALASSQLVDRFGRRILLLISCMIQTSSLIGIGLYFFWKTEGYELQELYWLPVACLVLYFLGFSLGLGPIGWSMMGELFDSEVKTLAATIANFVSKTCAFGITLVFPFISSAVGMAGGFWVLGVFTFAAFVFVMLFVPETKHKTFREIQTDLERKLFQVKMCRS